MHACSPIDAHFIMLTYLSQPASGCINHGEDNETAAASDSRKRSKVDTPSDEMSPDADVTWDTLKDVLQGAMY